MNEIVKTVLKKIIPEYILQRRRKQIKNKRFLKEIMDGFRITRLEPLTFVEYKKMEELHKKYKNMCVCFLPVNVIAMFCLTFYHFFDKVKKKDDCYSLFVKQFNTEERKYNLPNDVLYKMFCRRFEEINKQNINFWCVYFKKYLLDVEVYLPEDEHDFEVRCSKAYYLCNRQHFRRSAEVRLAFTQQEKMEGFSKLKNMGVGKKFVCFFSRDNAYYRKNFKQGIIKTETLSLLAKYRNSDIKQYYQMTEWLIENGLWSVRMGECVEHGYQCTGSVDYSNTVNQSAFMDVFLIAHCCFFIGDLSGVVEIAKMFFKPVVLINVSVVFIELDASVKADLMIFRRFCKNEKVLSLKDILQLQKAALGKYSKGNGAMNFWQYLSENNVKTILNTAEEICEVAKEMTSIINGTIQYSKEDIVLQEKYRNCIADNWPDKKVNAVCGRVGSKWLRDNKWFLE